MVDSRLWPPFVVAGAKVTPSAVRSGGEEN